MTRVSQIECAYKIIEYLKKNTDENNTISQAKLRNTEVKDYVRTKSAFNLLINQVALASNSSDDGFGMKDSVDWRINFDSFNSKYDNVDNCESNVDTDSEEESSLPIKGLYYKHIFNYEEIDRIIESLQFSKSLDTVRTNDIIEKIKKNLTTRFYDRETSNICKIYENKLLDDKTLSNNLIIIQNAIKSESQIAFQFNEYTIHKEMVPVDRNKDIISPYYIVANDGKYYLIGCKENNIKTKYASIWRIDLMTDIVVVKDGKKLRKISDKNDVKNLPQYWDENYLRSHINMSFDQPEVITLRIVGETKGTSKESVPKIKYTFLHDWFGDNFQHIKTESEYPFGEIIRVKCSPFGIVNWAMQYSSYVEVLEPIEIRNQVKEKINSLNKKYK